MPYPADSANIVPEPESLGFKWPEILLPAENINLYKWAVIACDQHTTDKNYWLQTAAETGLEPSTLNLILPEIYLEQPGFPVEETIGRINRNMRAYLDDGILKSHGPGCILVDRSTPLHPTRKGIILAIDLEAYDFRPGSSKLIRATEGTVLERIPPRMAIRRDALLELPHVQLLFDDPQNTVIDPLWTGLATSDPEPLYATGLMQGGGQVRGWYCPANDPLLAAALQAMARLATLRDHGLLFVVGDGNHSLATAKAHWEAMKSDSPADHPARFALVEAINIHDPGLDFEPIHRVIFSGDEISIIESAKNNFLSLNYEVEYQKYRPSSLPGDLDFTIVGSGGSWKFSAPGKNSPLAAAVVQEWLDKLVEKDNLKIDYVHGSHAVEDLVLQGNMGILLPPMPKKDFFPTIIKNGILPRKTFSMGSAFEKRYYMECRRIR